MEGRNRIGAKIGSAHPFILQNSKKINFLKVRMIKGHQQGGRDKSEKTLPVPPKTLCKETSFFLIN